MIRFIVTRGHRYTLNDAMKGGQATRVRAVNYADMLRAGRLRPATYIFSDLDRLSYWELELAGALYARLQNAGFTVLNDPAKARMRCSMLRALHVAGLNDFNCYRADELPSVMRMPVFVRKARGHGMPLSDLLHSMDEVNGVLLKTAEAGLPAENLIVIEYAGEPVREGRFRKLAAFRIGGQIVPHIGVNDTQWLVKYGSAEGVGEDQYVEEQETLQSNPYASHLMKAFQIAGIEYGRADFGFYKGRIQIFEINTNPFVSAPEPHPSAVRVENMKLAWKKYWEGLAGVDSTQGPAIPLRDREMSGDVRKLIEQDAFEFEARRRHTKSAERTIKIQGEEIERLRVKLEQCASKGRYILGETIDFSDRGASSSFTKEGWSTPEAWGRWTDGVKSRMSVRLEAAPPGDACILLEARAFVVPSHPAPRATLWLNGRELGSHVFYGEDFERARFPVPSGIIQTLTCEFIFRFENVLSPRAAGISEDDRILGLGFKSLQIAEASPLQGI